MLCGKNCRLVLFKYNNLERSTKVFESKVVAMPTQPSGTSNKFIPYTFFKCSSMNSEFFNFCIMTRKS